MKVPPVCPDILNIFTAKQKIVIYDVIQSVNINKKDMYFVHYN